MRDDQGTPAPYALSPEDKVLVAALRARREDAFRALVTAHHARLVAVAASMLHDRAVAEEVVQEAWLGVLQGIDRFEGRSSLKSWIYSIAIHKALSRREREARTVPFSALSQDLEGPAVDPERFLAEGEEWAGHWRLPPQSWGASPEELLYRSEIRALVVSTIESLPDTYRQVITLRDVDGLTGAEVCNVLGLSETNQRVILHRARARVRNALERRLTPGDAETPS